MNPVFPLEYLNFLCPILLLALWIFWRSTETLSRTLRASVFLFRLFVICMLVLAFINPGKWVVPKSEKDPVYALLLDRSASMSFQDVGAQSRFNAAREHISKILKRDLKNIRLEIFLFSDRLQSIGDIRDLDDVAPTGSQSNIESAVNAVLDRYRGRSELKGIFIFSDGRAIPEEQKVNVAARALAFGVRLHALCLGGPVVSRDIELQSMKKRYTTFQGQLLRVGLRVKNSNLGLFKGTVQMLDSAGKVLDKKDIFLSNNKEKNVRFEIAAPESSYSLFRFRVQRHPDEKRLDNNEVWVPVNVIDSKLNVLLVEGNPHWDSKFIVRLVRLQPYMRLTTVHRISSERFYRINEIDSDIGNIEQAEVFPETLEELKQFDVILMGKGVEHFLDRKRIENLKKYLGDHGGSILFTRGKPYSGVLELLEDIEPLKWGEFIDGDFKWQPTLAGQQSELFADSLPETGSALWDALPAISGTRKVKERKSFSQVLLSGKRIDAETEEDIIVFSRYGKGLTMAINSEGLWKWDFFPDSSESREFYRQFWIQSIKWAATFSEYLPGENYNIRVSKDRVKIGEPVRVYISQRQATEENVNGLELAVKKDGEVMQVLTPNRLQGLSTRWEALLDFEGSGTHRLELLGVETKPELTFGLVDVAALATEEDNYSADPDYLRSLCEEANGNMLNAETLFHAFKDHGVSIVNDNASAEWESSWDSRWALFAIFVMLGCEWVVRRRGGLL